MSDIKVKIQDQNLHEVQIKIDLPEEVKSVNKYITSCCFLLCIIMFILPFIICDLYIAYSSDSCLSENHFITLKTWLEVDGYTSLGGIIIISFLCYHILQVEIKKPLIFVVFLIYTYTLFNLSWLIIGSVLFWRDVSGCSSLTNDYLYTRLIFGFISIFFSANQ